jgi:TetR/AcrR family transcriptional repressor of nem operon
MCLDKLEAAGLAPDAASQLLATITGAMVVANAPHDIAAYDRATGKLLLKPDPVTPRATRRRSR